MTHVCWPVEASLSPRLPDQGQGLRARRHRQAAGPDLNALLAAEEDQESCATKPNAKRMELDDMQRQRFPFVV